MVYYQYIQVLRGNISKKEIHIGTDGGRPMRPIYYISDGKISWDRNNIKNILMNYRGKKWLWE